MQNKQTKSLNCNVVSISRDVNSIIAGFIFEKIFLCILYNFVMDVECQHYMAEILAMRYGVKHKGEQEINQCTA